MLYKLRTNPFFENDKKRLLKNRPLAAKDIEAALKSLLENPGQGDRIPGISSANVRKTRWALRAYGIGKSGGLRLVFLVSEAQQIVLPLTLWQKKDRTDESEVIALVKQRFKESIEVLNSGAQSGDVP